MYKRQDDDRSTLYGINKNPSVEQLEKAISSLYKCHDTIIAPSGLAALIIPFLTYLKKDDEVFNQAEQEFDGVDILIYNVGRSARELASAFVESKPETWLSVLEVSLITTLQMTHRAVPKMIDKGWGRIINMSSDAALVGDAGLADYAAAKSGLLGFTRVLARELALHGITVNAICPGAIRTRAHDYLDPSILERVKADIPMNRVGEPEDVANLVTFLSSDKANYITGQTIAVNGGRYMT